MGTDRCKPVESMPDLASTCLVTFIQLGFIHMQVAFASE